MANCNWRLIHDPMGVVVRAPLPHAEDDYNSRYDGRYIKLITEITEWLEQPERTGTYYTHTGGGEDHQSLYVFFSDDNTALEFKIRWVGAISA